MAELEAEIGDVIIDCADPASLASFRAELLGQPIAGSIRPYVWLERSAHAPGVGFQDGGFLVMADPHGNEFCVVPAAPFEFDEHGRADYLDNVDS